jgi:hypothetical protein
MLGIVTLFEPIKFATIQVIISSEFQKNKRSRGLAKLLLNLPGFSDQLKSSSGLNRY